MDRHTWHPNTFGLLYGKTTKTACGKRRPTGELVKALEATCRPCQDAVIAEMHEQQGMFDVATELAKQQGYASLAEWHKANREHIWAMLTSRKYRTPEQNALMRGDTP